jgi:hypothetical protein
MEKEMGLEVEAIENRTEMELELKVMELDCWSSSSSSRGGRARALRQKKSWSSSWEQWRRQSLISGRMKIETCKTS